MQRRIGTSSSIAAAILAAGFFCATVQAQQQDTAAEEGLLGRYEFWAGPVSWPGLDDIQPVAGEFDSVGLGLGMGFHFAIGRYQNSDLLVGLDMSFGGVDSDIDGFYSTVMARHMFLGGSAKWLLGASRKVSLDLGFGWHDVDIADMSTAYWGIEEELWASGRLGTWAGLTWDIGHGRPGKNGGLFIAAKAHFVDFGNVRDEGPVIAPVLGPAAGQLDGPIYFLEIGYSGR